MSMEKIESYAKQISEAQAAGAGDSTDVMSDIRYICKSCSLITEALQKGCDVLQMPSGDIVITEIKRVTLQYTWDDKKGKLVRTQPGANKIKKTRRINAAKAQAELESV